MSQGLLGLRTDELWLGRACELEGGWVGTEMERLSLQLGRVDVLFKEEVQKL